MQIWGQRILSNNRSSPTLRFFPARFSGSSLLHCRTSELSVHPSSRRGAPRGTDQKPLSSGGPDAAFHINQVSGTQ